MGLTRPHTGAHRGAYGDPCMQPARGHGMMYTHKEHMMIQSFLARLPDQFKMTLHNVVGHPVSELLTLFGFTEAATAVHDGTLP